MAANDGDWVPDGPVQPWWKYAFPTKDVFYANLVAITKVSRAAGPSPEPWATVQGELLEATAMLHAVSKISDPAMKARLQGEVGAKLQEAYKQVNAHKG